jgi:lysophospholipid hydrolase
LRLRLIPQDVLENFPKLIVAELLFVVEQSIIDRLASSFLNDGQNRFRKRDKMLFYGRRMLRKVKTISVTGEKGKKRRAVMKFARKLLQLQKDNLQPELKVTEPPAEYFEEIIDRRDKDKVPPDALYMLQSIRIFGQFEKPVFLKICKHTEIISLKAGEHLIKVGDSDDSVFIVQSGSVNVFLNNPDGTSISLKVVRKGETVTSLLSFIDVIVGNTSQYKTVTAKAIEDSTVIRLPMFAFKEVFDENPDILVRVIQVIMVRLQRVTISALHNYLGLSTEYIQVSVKKKQTPNVVPLPNIPKPQHKRQLSDQFSLVMCSSVEQRPDMINDIEFPIMVRRTSNLPQCDIPIDIELMKTAAVDGFLKELGLKDDDRPLISDSIEIKEISQGTTLTHQGSADDVLLIYVITGGLTLINHQPTKGNKKTDGNYITVHPGEVVGGLAVLTGESSLYTIKSKNFTRVGLLTKESVYKIMQKRPTVVLDIANSVVRGLSPLVRQCDFALDWVFLESGRAVYRQDEVSDCTYIVLNGRLRSVITHPNGKKEIVGEYGKGDLIGVVEMITESPRTTTVMAVRDSELAKLPEGLFNAIKLKYPVVVTQLISLLSHRLLGSMRGNMSAPAGSIMTEASPLKHSFATVAILSISDDVPLTAFTYELYHSLSSICPCARLTADVVRKTLGMNIMESSNEYRLTSWLSQQEDHHDISLYQCENILTPWTQRCLRQADVILIVGLADRTPTIGKLEREIDRFAIRTAKELVLLHHEATSTNSRPTNTVAWLNQRSWVSKHHHIQCPKRMFTRKSQYRVNDLYTKVLNSEPNIHSDFSRLARWLTGNSVGLVLGGGGARGAAHVGMLKAIQEGEYFYRVSSICLLILCLFQLEFQLIWWEGFQSVLSWVHSGVPRETSRQ